MVSCLLLRYARNRAFYPGVCCRLQLWYNVGMSEWKKLSLRARKLGEALSVADPTDLAKFSYDELIAQRNCGESTVREITDYLASRGLQLRTNNPPDCWPRPIPVSERLPEDGDEIMAFRTWQIPPYGEAGQWIAGEFHKEPARFVLDWVDSDGGDEFCWIVDSPSKRNITHWLPMPPKPE